ncbi:hypothetical protein CHO01_30460 [Cellulomonas hominis]|jgi:hypothetical protein|uniref:Glycoside hydrolase family 65 n=1 Tax=Cellulomonas hominis TaxID=156981 RepID=A0A511FFA8_9CELL|nr:hypothetical protein [Cellulomonas hominis]MBB5475491.1 hypothetical protein [Cellulomonas hominis]NKY06362.1 hypothetical protein [Cellulomonas hominis]GEL47930.1 hypothetical protein CHO01_30460 [Cellulomonas hominis]
MATGSAPLDRRALVRRHNPVLTGAHPVDTLTVGNGDIAMTVDVSGLQTFPDLHELRPDPRRVVSDGTAGLPEQRQRPFDRDDFQIPLRVESTWGWYATRGRRPYRQEEAATTYATARGPVPYLDRMGIQRAGDPLSEDVEPAAWLTYNPRRMHLGRLALVDADGRPLGDPGRLTDPRTELDLWTGVVLAEYRLDGEPVEVTTVADPAAHRFAVRVTSPLLARGLAVAWVFDPQRDDLAWFEQPVDAGTRWQQPAPGRATAQRRVESSAYEVDVVSDGFLTVAEGGGQVVARSASGSLELVVALRPEGVEPPAPARFADVLGAAEHWWAGYWGSGAAVSLAGSTDPAAAELERRIVLSQYLMAVNSAGSAPPAETGLTYNTWTGKFHLEMHWWHGAHFPMWGRGHLLERSLPWYHGALGSARATARAQGYRGARWPKQTDLSARESPSVIGVFLVWQQPHLIHLLELLLAEGRGGEFLAEHYPLVEATADFMADFAEERDGAYVLPPPLIPAQESYLVDRETVTNPTFELAYWAWALGVANRWRERLNLAPREDWARVADGMHRPALMPDGTYAAIESAPHLIRKDHPSMLMALGWLPDTPLVDAGTMAATLDEVWRSWDLQSSWGWDYPVMAMTAARLGDLRRALDALLLESPKNVFLPNGHNPQMPGFLTLYLPANGGLLAAVAHLAAAVADGVPLPPGWVLDAEGFAPFPRGDRPDAT